MPTYRAFPHRYFIDVHWLDIEAESPKKAAKVALKAVQKSFPKEAARASATDNHWSLDKLPSPIQELGISISGPQPMALLYEDSNGKAYISPYTFNKLDLRMRSSWDDNNLVLVEETQLRQAIDFCKELIANPNISVQVKAKAADLIETLLKEPQLGGA